MSQVKLPKNYKPTKKEDYMGPKQLEYFRLKLLDWRQSLLEESQQTIDQMRDAARDVSDEAERASREAEITFELRTRDRYRKLLARSTRRSSESKKKPTVSVMRLASLSD